MDEVGDALRNNPFAPYIPCHRVVASDFFIGGFRGEWGTGDKTGTHCHQKINLLTEEGVRLTKGGHLVDAGECSWIEQVHSCFESFLLVLESLLVSVLQSSVEWRQRFRTTRWRNLHTTSVIICRGRHKFNLFKFTLQTIKSDQ